MPIKIVNNAPARHRHSAMTRRRSPMWPLLAAACGLTLAVAGCSSSASTGDGGGSPGAPGSTGSGSLAANVKTACSRAQAGTDPVTFKAPGASVDPSVMKGKKIWIIPITGTGTVAQYVSTMKSVASLLGATVVVTDAQGSIPNAVTDVNQAVAGGANVIVNVAVQPSLLTRAMKAAQAKGIKVISVLNDQSDAPLPAGVDGSVSWDYVRGGKWRMDEAICTTQGKLKLGLITSNDIPVGKNAQNGMRSEISELCPSTCKIISTDIPTAQWATGLGTATTNLLQRNPGINYFMDEYGAMLITSLPALKRFDPSGKIPTSSFDNEFENLPGVLDGTIQSDVGTSVGALGWPTMDQAIRLLSGQKAVIEAGPTRLITTALAKKLGLSSKNSVAQNDELMFGDVVTGAPYKALWGLG